MIIVPCYLDPLEILHACIESLAAQASPTKLVVVVTFEKKTPDLRAKMASVQERFSEAFGALLVVGDPERHGFSLRRVPANGHFSAARVRAPCDICCRKYVL